jgi:hypothetical protein
MSAKIIKTTYRIKKIKFVLAKKSNLKQFYNRQPSTEIGRLPKA